MQDDQRDKEMMRNQVIAIVLMTVLVVAWFTFYAPKPSAQPPAPVPQAAAPADQKPPVEDAPEPGAASTPAEDANAWTHLPPVADESLPDDDVTIENDLIRLVFTKVGGRLKEASVILGENGQDSIQLVPKPEEGTPESAAAYPMALRFTDASLGQQLDRRRFDIEPASDNRSVTFKLELPGIAAIRKTFRLDERPYVVTVQVSYENLEPATRVLGMDDTPAFYLDWKPNVASGDLKKGVQQAVSWYKNGSLESLDTVKLKPGAEGAQFTETIPDPAWIAIRSAYFIVAMKPDFDKTRAEIQGVQEKFRAGLSVPRFEVRSGETATYAFTTYLGPSHLPALKSAWPTLDAVLRFFETFDSMDWFAKLLLTLLVWFHDHVIANYGMAIIFLTVLVRVVMYPLTLKSMKSMKKMQLLAPEMEAIKKQYGDDPQVQQQKIMEMYKERGVNPLGGCFPMLLQMPVFIALYRMLWSAFELRGAPFYWWVTDLSEPDSLFRIPGVEQIPFLSAFGYLNILPILMGIAMVISQKLMPASGPAQNPQQKFIMTFMPIFFSFICYSMPSGLNLYILTSTILGIVQQQFTSVGDINAEPKKKTPRKRQHFYTAAMARKRRLAKETRQDRKGKRPDKN